MALIDRLDIGNPNNSFQDFENLYDVNDDLCFLNYLPTPDKLLLHIENVDLSKSSGVQDINIKQCKDVFTDIPDIICCINPCGLWADTQTYNNVKGMKKEEGSCWAAGLPQQ